MKNIIVNEINFGFGTGTLNKINEYWHREDTSDLFIEYLPAYHTIHGTPMDKELANISNYRSDDRSIGIGYNSLAKFLPNKKTWTLEDVASAVYAFHKENPWLDKVYFIPEEKEPSDEEQLELIKERRKELENELEALNIIEKQFLRK